MNDSLTSDDFKQAMKNPFYEKLNTEIVVPVRKEVYQIFEQLAEQNGERPEKLMRRCLTEYAKKFQESV